MSRTPPGNLAFTLFLGGLSALPPLSVDMGLPGLPAIEATFPDAAGHGALTLSVFLAGFAVAPLICGPVADRFGRRPLLLAGLLIFVCAAASCGFAPSFPLLLACRLVQGLAAGACVVAPFAIVRDRFSDAEALKHLARVTAVLGIAPLVAPVLGGWMLTVANWRAIYTAQALCGFVLLIVTLFWFQETLPAGLRRPLRPRHLAGSYAAVFSDPAFRSHTLLYAFGFGCMFSFISSAPSVLMGDLGLSTQMFSLLFALTSCGTLLGSLASGRLSGQGWSSTAILWSGVGLMAAAAITGCLLAALGIIHIVTLVAPAGLAIFCFALTGPSASHEALRGLGAVAGAASGVLRFAQMTVASIASAAIAALGPFGHTPVVMTGAMAALSLCAVAAFGQFRWSRRAALVR